RNRRLSRGEAMTRPVCFLCACLCALVSAGHASAQEPTSPQFTPPAQLQEAADHKDGYVRYRALVLLTGFNDPRTKDAMRESLVSPNDRLRAVGYSFFEHNHDPAMIPQMLAALDK